MANSMRSFFDTAINYNTTTPPPLPRAKRTPAKFHDFKFPTPPTSPSCSPPATPTPGSGFSFSHAHPSAYTIGSRRAESSRNMSRRQSNSSTDDENSEDSMITDDASGISSSPPLTPRDDSVAFPSYYAAGDDSSEEDEVMDAWGLGKRTNGEERRLDLMTRLEQVRDERKLSEDRGIPTITLTAPHSSYPMALLIPSRPASLSLPLPVSRSLTFPLPSYKPSRTNIISTLAGFLSRRQATLPPKLIVECSCARKEGEFHDEGCGVLNPLVLTPVEKVEEVVYDEPLEMEEWSDLPPRDAFPSMTLPSFTSYSKPSLQSRASSFFLHTTSPTLHLPSRKLLNPRLLLLLTLPLFLLLSHLFTSHIAWSPSLTTTAGGKYYFPDTPQFLNEDGELDVITTARMEADRAREERMMLWEEAAGMLLP